MFARQALVSLLHLFLLFFFFSASFLILALPDLPELRQKLIVFITDDLAQIRLLGGIGLGISLVLFFSFYLLHRGRYLVLKMGTFVDLKLVQQSVQGLFQNAFARKIGLKQVEMGKHSSLRFEVELSSLKEEERLELLQEVERQLSTLLQIRFGYCKPFSMLVSQK